MVIFVNFLDFVNFCLFFPNFQIGILMPAYHLIFNSTHPETSTYDEHIGACMVQILKRDVTEILLFNIKGMKNPLSLFNVT